MLLPQALATTDAVLPGTDETVAKDGLTEEQDNANGTADEQAGVNGNATHAMQ